MRFDYIPGVCKGKRGIVRCIQLSSDLSRTLGCHSESKTEVIHAGTNQEQTVVRIPGVDTTQVRLFMRSAAAPLTMETPAVQNAQ